MCLLTAVLPKKAGLEIIVQIEINFNNGESK